MPGETAPRQRVEIGGRLRNAREAAGLTQAQVAKKMKLHRPAIAEIEAGRRRVSADELAVLAELYAVGVEWITSGKSSNDTEDKIKLAARQLSKMKEEDLDRLMSLIRMVRSSKE